MDDIRDKLWDEAFYLADMKMSEEGADPDLDADLFEQWRFEIYEDLCLEAGVEP